MPDFLRASLDAAGFATIDRVPLPMWTLDGARKDMDAAGIDSALVTSAAPCAYPNDQMKSRALVRQFNEFLADLSARYPKKFGGLTLLPSLTDVDGACDEIEYGLDTLKLDGVSLFTSYDKSYVGDTKFSQVFQVLEQYKCTVHIHPSSPPDGGRCALPPPPIDYPLETTRAAVNLAVTGTLIKCPNVKFILSHAGGALPYVAHRLKGFLDPNASPAPENVPADGPEKLKSLRSFYFDLALTPEPGVLDLAAAFLGSDRLLLGSDMPYAGGEKVHQILESQIERFPEIMQNGETLFPRFSAGSKL